MIFTDMIKSIIESIKDFFLGRWIEKRKNKILFSKKIECVLVNKEVGFYYKGFLLKRRYPFCPHFKMNGKCEVPITSADGKNKQNKKRILRSNNGKCYIWKHYE